MNHLKSQKTNQDNTFLTTTTISPQISLIHEVVKTQRTEVGKDVTKQA